MDVVENKDGNVSFCQGGELVSREVNDCINKIKQQIAELFNIKNVNFLFGAGTSSGAIPSMKSMQEEIKKNIDESLKEKEKTLYGNIDSNNLEKKLTILYAKKHYLKGVKPKDKEEIETVEKLIKHVEGSMYGKINIDLSARGADRCLNLYKIFYQKTVLRNKDLARVNVFTTNNDLFNEKALDALNINFNNGFGGGLERFFNPARFHYTFSKKIDTNLEKFEPLENMVYLYKLHGSISWIEKEGNALFNIQEVPVVGNEAKGDEKHVLIYPTPLKQSQSLGAPYADLIREFQTKLSLPNSVIFIIGYSFSDEHINDIIYQALTSNSSLSVVIFGEYSDCPLSQIKDSRIYRIFGTDQECKEVHYFEYIVKELLPHVDVNIDKSLLDAFVNSLNMALKTDGDK
ncbi:MAG: SIR2 family protein [Kiritimatiellae bacterium]|jgi:hypothetical protein|nr:SIR2 family protein [Kiritimatiellia bacterium]